MSEIDINELMRVLEHGLHWKNHGSEDHKQAVKTLKALKQQQQVIKEITHFESLLEDDVASLEGEINEKDDVIEELTRKNNILADSMSEVKVISEGGKENTLTGIVEYCTQAIKQGESS